MSYIIAVFVLGFLAAVWVANTRVMRLKRLAKNLQMRYDAQVEYIITPEAFFNARFFQDKIHRFSQVLTKQESGAFIRVCEDKMAQIPLTHSLQEDTFTLVTAELTRGAFTPFVLRPRLPEQTDLPHPALPAALAEKYRLLAPADYRLPEVVLGFLQAAKPCYLELTPTALIYHEFDKKPVQEIQPLRFRVKQLINALIQQPEPVPASGPAVDPVSEESLQAAVLLKLQTAQPRTGVETAAGSNRWIYGIILLLVLAGLCFFAGFALQHWVHR